MNVYALILAGGSGKRAGTEIPKQYIELKGVPVIGYSLRAFQQSDAVTEIRVVCDPYWADLVRDTAVSLGITKFAGTVPGGAERKDSSYNGIRAITATDDAIVLIHDAARPFVDAEIINDCIAKTAAHGAAGAYAPCSDTIALADDGVITAVPERTRCFAAQTPQGFRYGLIRRAHEKTAPGAVFTDDISLVMTEGMQPAVSLGKPGNFKITNPRDFDLALTCLC